MKIKIPPLFSKNQTLLTLLVLVIIGRVLRLYNLDAQSLMVWRVRELGPK